MKAVLILALIVALCTCSSVSFGARKKLPAGGGKDEKITLSRYEKDNIRISKPGQQSQANEKEQRRHDALMKKIEKDPRHELEKIGKTVTEELKKPKYKLLMEKLESKQWLSFKIEDEDEAKSIFCKAFNQKPGASEDLLKQTYFAVRNSYQSFVDCRRISDPAIDAFLSMGRMASKLGWECDDQCFQDDKKGHDESTTEVEKDKGDKMQKVMETIEEESAVNLLREKVKQKESFGPEGQAFLKSILCGTLGLEKGELESLRLSWDHASEPHTSSSTQCDPPIETDIDQQVEDNIVGL
jgi:hypothetical protein